MTLVKNLFLAAVVAAVAGCQGDSGLNGDSRALSMGKVEFVSGESGTIGLVIRNSSGEEYGGCDCNLNQKVIRSGERYKILNTVRADDGDGRVYAYAPWREGGAAGDRMHIKVMEGDMVWWDTASFSESLTGIRLTMKPVLGVIDIEGAEGEVESIVFDGYTEGDLVMGTGTAELDPESWGSIRMESEPFCLLPGWYEEQDLRVETDRGIYTGRFGGDVRAGDTLHISVMPEEF